MSTEMGKCEIHGRQELAFACIHICRAVDSKKRVGFVCDPESDAPRPDAWCGACERWNAKHQDSSLDEWMKVAAFQLLCVKCWDEAKAFLTSDPPRRPNWFERLRLRRRKAT